jgi:hypothetical protein
MSRTPISPHLIHDPEKTERRRRVFDALCARLLPFVREAVEPLMRREMAAPLPAEEEESLATGMAAFAMAFEKAEASDDPEAELGRMAKKLDERFAGRSALEPDDERRLVEIEREARSACVAAATEEEIAHFTGEEARTATAQVASSWHRRLLKAAADGILDPATLDEYGLPPGTDADFLLQAFTVPIGIEEARGILRKIRASLPDSKVLPDEMIDLLAIDGVTLAPLH